MDIDEGDRRLRIADGVDWVLVEGEVVAVDADDGVHLIGPPGAMIWQLLDGRSSVAEIAADADSVFGGPDLDVAGDVVAFSRTIEGLGLVVDANGAGPR